MHVFTFYTFVYAMIIIKYNIIEFNVQNYVKYGLIARPTLCPSVHTILYYLPWLSIDNINKLVICIYLFIL